MRLHFRPAGMAVSESGMLRIGGKPAVFPQADQVGIDCAASFCVTRTDARSAQRRGWHLRWSQPGSSRTADSLLTLWDIDSRRVLRTASAYTNRVTAVALSADRPALVGGADRKLRLVHLRENIEVLTLRDHRWVVTSVGCSPDGLVAVSGSRDRTIKFWDVATGKLLRTIFAHREGGVSSVAFSPDGRTCALRRMGLGNAAVGRRDRQRGRAPALQRG